MNPPVADLPLTARERLRWRRAMDAQLIDAIFGHVVRDALPPSPIREPRPRASHAASAAGL